MSDPFAVPARVDAELDGFLSRRSESLAAVSPDLKAVTDAARDFVLAGGKRLRPTFAYWGWRAVQPEGADESTIVRAAASLELLHGCALVHDDVMDASATRRGHPSAHAAFAAMHRTNGWPGDADVFGESAAILLGDLLLSWADAMFAESISGASGAAGRRAREVYDTMRELVMAGQYLDVLVQARGRFDPDEAITVAQLKTAKYTIEGPLHLGAAIGGADERVFAALSAYGLPLGEAFQLRDDVLGVFGDPSTTGKPAGDDLREGKRTLLVALAMRQATPSQASVLRTHLGHRDLDGAAVDDTRSVLVETGALDAVEARIADRAAEALRALDDDCLQLPARVALGTLATAATERSA